MPLSRLVVARRAVACAVALLAAAFVVSGAAQVRTDETYNPTVGQSGKNVVWVPTPDSLVSRMLRAAKTTDKDIVYDLGAGDGKIPIAAARDFKARAVGIEYNPDMAKLAERNAARAGVSDKVKIIAGDIFENDFSKRPSSRCTCCPISTSSCARNCSR